MQAHNPAATIVASAKSATTATATTQTTATATTVPINPAGVANTLANARLKTPPLQMACVDLFAAARKVAIMLPVNHGEAHNEYAVANRARLLSPEGRVACVALRNAITLALELPLEAIERIAELPAPPQKTKQPTKKEQLEQALAELNALKAKLAK